MCQPMPTGLYTQWDLDPQTSRFTRRWNNIRCFENMVMPYFQRTRPECKIKSFYTTGRKKKNDRFNVNGFCSHCHTVFEAMGHFHHFRPCQPARPSFTEMIFIVVVKRRSSMNWYEAIYEKKASRSMKFRTVDDGDCTRLAILSKIYPIKPSVQTFTCDSAFIRRKKNGKIFGYDHGDKEVHKNLSAKFPKFPPIFKNTLVSKNDFGNLMKTCDEDEGIMSQPRRRLIASFTMQNVNRSLLCFYSTCNCVSFVQ